MVKLAEEQEIKSPRSVFLIAKAFLCHIQINRRVKQIASASAQFNC